MMMLLSRCPPRLCSQTVEKAILQCRRHNLTLTADFAAATAAARPASTTAAHHGHPWVNRQESRQFDLGKGHSLNFTFNNFPRQFSSLSSFGGGINRDQIINEFDHYYTQVGGPIDPSTCTIPEDDIHNLIRERMQCRHAREFAKADILLAELRKFGVDVDDKSKEWRADGTRMISSEPVLNEFGHYYTHVGGTIDPSICSLPENEIHNMICERMICKAERDFRKADGIREELNKCGVSIDDKLRQWRADGWKPNRRVWKSYKLE